MTKNKPSMCPYGKDILRCQDCDEYYFEGLGYCGISHPKKEKENGKDGEQDDHCGLVQEWFDTYEEAANAWNRRTKDGDQE